MGTQLCRYADIQMCGDTVVPRCGYAGMLIHGWEISDSEVCGFVVCSD